MNHKIILIFLLFFSTAAFAQTSYTDLIKKADKSYQEKDYEKSVETFSQAFKLEQKSGNDLYNAACAAALAGNTEKGLLWLNLSLDHGFTNYDHLKKDSDLKSLYPTKGWKTLLVKVDQLIEKREAKLNKPVKEALEAIYETDQGSRQNFLKANEELGPKNPKVIELVKVMNHHDSINGIKVMQILDQYGWLGVDEVGQKGNSTLFLVIQHSDLLIQVKYLPMLRAAVKAGKAQPSSLALLEDRVALRQGRRQIYGSQIRINNEKNVTYLSPMIDPDHVDERRASVGLGPIADYIKNWKLVWNVEEYKKNLPEYEKWENIKP